MSLRNGLWVCMKAQFLALIWQVVGSWILLDRIVSPVVTTCLTFQGAYTDVIGRAWFVIGYTRYVPIILCVGGLIYLFINPFIQEGSGDVLDR
jgi:hypothetical protein